MTFDDGPAATIPRGAEIHGRPEVPRGEVWWDGKKVSVDHAPDLHSGVLTVLLWGEPEPCRFQHRWDEAATKCVRCGAPAPILEAREPQWRIERRANKTRERQQRREQADEFVALYREEKKRKDVPPWPRPASWWLKTPDRQGPDVTAMQVRRVGPYHLHASIEREHGAIPAKMRGSKALKRQKPRHDFS